MQFILSIQFPSGWYALNELFNSRESAERAGIESHKPFTISPVVEISCECYLTPFVCERCADYQN